MGKTKEQKATVMECVDVLQEMLREHIVGVVEKKDDTSLSFRLPGGKTFSVRVEEE